MEDVRNLQPVYRSQGRRSSLQNQLAEPHSTSEALSAVDVDLSAIVARSTAVMGWIGVALIHLLDAGGKYNETRYIFWMYVGLIVSSLALAATHLHRDAASVWLATGVLALSVIAGYCLSRTTGLPAATGDVGNWSEPLGLASLLIEGALVTLAGYCLAIRSRQSGQS